MSVVAMVVLSRESRWIRIMRYFTRALSSRNGCGGVLGLFDDAVSPRALLFAPLRLPGRKRLENTSVLQAASAKT
jgi:hypothetical protein